MAKAKSRAIELKKEGLTVRAITQVLKDEGYNVSKTTVAEWIKNV